MRSIGLLLCLCDVIKAHAKIIVMTLALWLPFTIILATSLSDERIFVASAADVAAAQPENTCGSYLLDWDSYVVSLLIRLLI